MLIRRETRTGSDDLQIVYRPYKVSEIIGNETNKNILKNNLDGNKVPHSYLFTGHYGCVDCDTEFLTPTGWKTIDKYNEGGLVLQYNKETMEADFVVPDFYIKRKSNTPMFHFKTKYGLNQCLSDDHMVYYISGKGKTYTKPFSYIRKNHIENSQGFSGKFFTSFNIKNDTKLQLTDEELRVQVMVVADTNFIDGRKKCCLNLKKVRKIKRAVKLLEVAGISFDKYTMGNGYTRLYFIPPMRIKKFTPDFYSCSRKQLDVITSEVLFWDGDQESIFYSTIKESADFIQYAFAATNVKASINIDDRKGKPLTYRVIRSSTNLSKISPATKIDLHIPRDGYQYCFTVPTGCLVLRRDNCIFITGNCGKTTAARVLAMGLNCEKGVSSEPCMECASCLSILNNNSIDVREVNVGQSGTKGDIAALAEDFAAAPFMDRFKIVILDECQELTKASQKLLLKKIEDGFKHVYFILCTNEPEKLGGALISRCNRMHFDKMSSDNLSTLLLNVCEFEGVEYNIEVLNYIATEVKGVPRGALTWLKDVMDESSWTLEAAKSLIGVTFDEDNPVIIDISKSLLKGEFKPAIKMYIKLNVSAETLRGAIAGYFVGCLKRAKSYGQGRKFSSILDIITVPIYDPGKLADHKIINYFFKVADLMSNGGK